jgi:hypothetical protein
MIFNNFGFETLEQLKKQGKIIGFTASTADLNHAGLMIMLEQLKNESVNINDSFIFYDEIESSFNYLYLSHYLYLD